MQAVARLKCVPLTAFVGTISRPSQVSLKQLPTLRLSCQVCRTQNYANQARTRGTSLRQFKVEQQRGPTLKERIMAPAGDGGKFLGKTSYHIKLC